MIEIVNMKTAGEVAVSVLCGCDKFNGQLAYFAQSSENQNHYYRVWSDDRGDYHCECSPYGKCRHIKAVKAVVMAEYRAKQAAMKQAEELAATAIECRVLEEDLANLKDLYRDAADAHCYGEMELLESSILWRERRLEEIEEKQHQTRRNRVQKMAA